MFLGKTLVVFEDLKTPDARSWDAANSTLKQLTTGATFMMEMKQKEKRPVRNTCNFNLASNNEAVKVSEGFRRLVSLDVSNSKIGDRAYFSRLAHAMNKDVGEAFFWMCMDRVKGWMDTGRNWEKSVCTEVPKSKTTTNIVCGHLHPVYEWVKRTFLLNKKGIELTRLKEFHQKYVFGQDEKKGAALKDVQLAAKLREIGIQVGKTTCRKKRIIGITCVLPMDFDDLKAIYEKKGWIADIDDFVKIVNPDEVDFSDDEAEPEYEVAEDTPDRVLQAYKQARK